MTMRGKFALATLPMLCLFAGAAHGHAELERASPPVGGIVTRPPGEIRLWFTEQLAGKIFDQLLGIFRSPDAQRQCGD